MTELEELTKIRKLLAWIVREMVLKKEGAEYEETNFEKIQS